MDHMDMPGPRLPLWFRLFAITGVLTFMVLAVMAIDKFIHWWLR